MKDKFKKDLQKMKEKKRARNGRETEKLVQKVKAQKKCATVRLDVAIAYS